MFTRHTVLLTRNNVPEANGSHGDKAEVETIKEGPVLPEGEEEGSTTEEDAKEDKSSSHCVHIVAKTHLIVFISFPEMKC